MFDRRFPLWFRPIAVIAGAACLMFSPGAGRADDGIRDNLFSVTFPTPQSGWACGAFGAVIHTSDAGATWSVQKSNADQPLFSIKFVDERLGWAVGRSGTIIHTSDAGEHWRRQTSPNDKHLFAVDFADDVAGIATGDWGVIVATEDGGVTWVERSLPEDIIINSVSVIDRSTAIIVGEMGAIYRTDDFGRNWRRLDSGIEKTLFGVRCIDAHRCWAVGIDALILHTADGGESWEVLHGSPEMRPLEQVGFGQAFENPSIYAIDLAGSFGVAAGEIGSVFLSEDAGKTWTRLDASKNWALPWFRDLVVHDGRRGAIVGARGRRIMIEDGKIEIDAGED